MKVMYVISGLGLGGAERQVVMLAREMARRGHAVRICTLNEQTARADELQGSTVELRVDQKRRKLDWALVRRLRRQIAEWRPDVVHGFLYDGNLYARLAGAGLGVPVLSSERNHDYRLSRLQRLALRLTAPLSAGVVANTHAGAAFAERLHGMPPERVHTVWNGIELGELDARLAAGARPAAAVWPDARRVCVVGSLKPQKDPLLALRVARCLLDADPSWRFLFVGDELGDRAFGYKAEVLAEWRRLGLEAAVAFLGHRRDVPQLMASSDVVLVTSVHEGFPNVVLEAMACGTPVASTAYSDVRRILPMPWQVAPERDAQTLAAVVRRCHAEHDEVAHAQRRWVEAHATAAASAEAMLRVYAGCLRGPRVRAAEKLS
jgi:glycosyltransferase involved in cell wall biosynthesis